MAAEARRTTAEVFDDHLARARRGNIDDDLDGVDTFVVRDGRIVAQTIHYTVQSGTEAPARE